VYVHLSQMCEERQIDTDSLVHANPIGEETPANPIGDDGAMHAKLVGDDQIGDGEDKHAKLIGEYQLGDGGGIHAIREYDQVAMSEFLDGADLWSYHTTSMPSTKKRKNTPSIQTEVRPLHEMRALADERLTGLVYVRRLTSATAEKPPRIISSTTTLISGHPILHQCKRPANSNTHRQRRPRYLRCM